jgi:hypothetical protein
MKNIDAKAKKDSILSPKTWKFGIIGLLFLFSLFHPLLYPIWSQRNHSGLVMVSLISSVGVSLAISAVSYIFIKIDSKKENYWIASVVPYVLFSGMSLLAVILQGGISSCISVAISFVSDGEEGWGRLFFAVTEPIVVLPIAGMVLWTERKTMKIHLLKRSKKSSNPPCDPSPQMNTKKSLVQIKYFPEWAQAEPTLLISVDASSIHYLKDFICQMIESPAVDRDLSGIEGFRVYGKGKILVSVVEQDIGLRMTENGFQWHISKGTWEECKEKLETFSNEEPRHHYLEPRVESDVGDITVRVSYHEYAPDWRAWYED